jgi:hypothetical protein
MPQIGRDSSLLALAIQIQSFLMPNANRIEVIDLANPRFDNISGLFLENRVEQDDRRGPTAIATSPI